MMPLTKSYSRNLNVWILIAIILGGLALYALPLQNGSFYYDDTCSIEYNDAIKSIDLRKIFNAFNSRFLVGLSFALNYQWGGLQPFGYRLINVLIHCFNAFLVYCLFKSTLSLYLARKPKLTFRLEWPALFAALLFLCHPIQTEPVNFITQRFVLMGTFFYLLTLYLYIQYRCQLKKRYLIASLLSAIAAMFCKEFVITLPIMLALYDFYFLNSLNETPWKRYRRLVPFFIIILIVPILLLRTSSEAIRVANIADYNLVQEQDRQTVKIDITRAHGGVSRQQYFLTELNVLCTYVRLLFVPINQNLDYDYPVVSKLGGKTILSGAFLLCLLAIAIVTYKAYRMISFGILWFFIALSVESSFIPIGHVIAEYRLYLASVGFVFLIMSLLYIRQIDVKKLNIIAAVLLISFSVLTYQRNNIWKDELILWEDTILKSPHKARPFNNLGAIYVKRGNFNQAMAYYNKAIEIEPNYADVYYNRAVVHDQQGNRALAIADCTKAIAINPNLAEAYYNRGSVYAKEGNAVESISDLTKAITINPNLAQAYYNRGSVYDKQGQLIQAIADLTRAIEIDSNYAEAYNNRGSIYIREGNFNQALPDFTKAIKINPKLAEAYNNRGGIYLRQGEGVQALSDFNKAIEINPNLAEAYFNIGMIYDQQGNLAEAIERFNKAIEINPHLAQVYYNRGVIYDKQGQPIQAISDFTKAIEINPNFPEFYNNRGASYLKQGDFTKAIFDFTKAIAIVPNYAEAQYNRAIAYYQLKTYDRAWVDLKRAKELGAAVNPGFVSLLKEASGQDE